MSGVTRVSVVIPVFNGKALLPEAIQSLLVQTRPPDEILVVDDGSTDGSADVAADFGAPVKVVAQTNQGRSAARNTGLDRATGDLVGFLDADDRCRPDRIARQLSELARNPDVVAVITGLARIGAGPDHDGPVGESWADETVQQLRPVDFVTQDVGHPASLLARAGAVRGVRFPIGVHVAEDRIFLGLLRRVGPIGYVPDPLYLYRIDPMRVVTDGPWIRFNAVHEWLRTRHDDVGVTGPEAEAISYRMLAEDIALLYYRRDLDEFYHQQARLRSAWPHDLPAHAILSIRGYPRLLLKLKDFSDSLRSWRSRRRVL